MQQLSAGLRWWFESLDRARRHRGTTMDRFGYGPRESDFQTVLAMPGLRLRSYAADGAHAKDGPVALIIPAPIKRHYIWDLAPDCSVVRRALEKGMRVYLIEWTDPEGQTTRYGLEEYGHTLIDRCLQAIDADSPGQNIFLLGHSLGGVFAAIYASLEASKVAGIVLVETPLHFAESSGSFAPLVAAAPRADKMTKVFERVPGSMLSLISTVASPATFQTERYADFMASLGSPRHLKSHILVERWTLDEAPMAGALFEQVVENLYREDSLMRNKLHIKGEQVGPESMSVPLLSVYDPRSVVIPPASVIAYHEAAASPAKLLLRYEGDTGVGLSHVGALVGENAHRRLWPSIFQWIDGLEGRTTARH